MTSCAHFTAGPAIRTRSPKSSGSVMVWRESCWPAVTTSGVPETLALKQVADAVTEAARRVQVDEAGPARRLGVAVGHGDHARFLQRPDIADIRRVEQRVHQRQLGRAGIAEHVAHALAAQDFEQNVAPRRAASLSTVSIIVFGTSTALRVARRREGFDYSYPSMLSVSIAAVSCRLWPRLSLRATSAVCSCARSLGEWAAR